VIKNQVRDEEEEKREHRFSFSKEKEENIKEFNNREDLR